MHTDGDVSPQRVYKSTYGFSPEKQNPLSELDLSDESQPDITERAEAELADAHSHSIVVVDALSQRLSDDVAEVAVTERLEVSPYKVICHSPRAAKISLINSGDTQAAANVHVDLMHSTLVKSSSRPSKISEEPLPVQLEPCDVDQTEETEVDDDRSQSCSESSNASSVVELGAAEPTSFKDISQELERIKSENSVKDPQSKPKKKKKTGRVVASRLMETTAAHRAKAVGQSQQSSYQTMLQRSGSTRQQKYLNEVNSNTERPPRGVTGRALSTPINPPVKSRRQASTPENIAPNESFDVSVVKSNRSTINRVLNETESFMVPPEPQKKSRSKLNSSAGRVKQDPLKKPSAQPKEQIKSSTPEDITQDCLDVQYARYLQWLFLSSKAQKSIETEEKDVMSQLHSLWLENHKMKQKLSSLDQEYDRLKHVTDLDETLDLQKTLLGPLVHELPQLGQNYQNMALALDTTRHELQTEGIHIPDNKHEQEEFEGALMSALDESEQLLAAISSQTRRNVSTTSQYAQAIDTLTKSVYDENTEVNRCKELVKAAQTLSNHENSLKIQEIELSRV